MCTHSDTHWKGKPTQTPSVFHSPHLHTYTHTLWASTLQCFLHLPCGTIRGVNLYRFPAALHELHPLAFTDWHKTYNTHWSFYTHSVRQLVLVRRKIYMKKWKKWEISFFFFKKKPLNALWAICFAHTNQQGIQTDTQRDNDYYYSSPCGGLG